MRKLLSLLFFVVAFLPCAWSQQIDSALAIQQAADPQEKIYVQFDKNYYNPGETIWFKAYVFAGLDLSDVSKNFYAELLDEQGNIISQKTAPIIFSGAFASFDIDSSYNKPAVYFRAYTIAMLNSDTSFLFNKAIRILPRKAIATSPKNTTPVLPATIHFFPEGGDWIAGLTSTVAFIATNSEARPVNLTGIVTDSKGTKVADLTTLHNGMGRFSLIPAEGQTYTAIWKDAAGKQYTTPLPLFKPQGVALKITDEENGKRFAVYRSGQVPDVAKRLYIIGYMNQQVIFKASLNLSNKISASGLFPTANLPSGILQITLFDSLYTPVAERITFVNNHDYEFDGDVFLTQKNLAPRGLNQVEIVLSDPMPANLSLGITDADLNESAKMDDNIISRILLTGDLKGKITDPYYYFFSNSDSVSIHMDLVMLTHGWRRYNWENVIANKTKPLRWKESNFLSLSGQVTGLMPGSFSNDLQLTGILQTADSAKNFVHLAVDRNGKVFTDGFVFYDNAKLFFNFNKKNLSFDKTMLIVDNGLRKGYNKTLLDSIIKKGITEVSAATIANNINTNRMSLEAMRKLANSKMMDNITIKAKVKTTKDKMEEKYVSGLFSGDAKGFDLVNDPLASAYMDIFQYLQGKVAGLQITTGAGDPSLSWRGGTPVLYLNEMQTDVNMISSTPVSDIAYVKVFRPGESMVSGGGGGVIAIYTRRGGDSPPSANSKGLNYVQLMGYSAIKEFYSPDYTVPNERDALDDVRTTLYWNPSIILDKTRRRIRLKFYNNDITKRFRVIMEGLNAEGKLIHVEKEITN
jgi:hypothetical protein